MKAEMGGAGICSGYGLTEAPILVLVDVGDPDDKKAETEGKPMPGVELKLVKLDGTVAGPGEEGEIRAKAPQMMRGYLDASLDADAFDQDGWFRTGDLGQQDADGYLIITGRLKDIIIRNMENISAKEVEDLLFEHPQVGDVAVIGLPDERTGERVVAVVVTAEGQDADQLRDHEGAPAGQGSPQAGAPRAARVHRRPPAEPHRQGGQVRAPRPVRGLGCRPVERQPIRTEIWPQRCPASRPTSRTGWRCARWRSRSRSHRGVDLPSGDG